MSTFNGLRLLVVNALLFFVCVSTVTGKELRGLTESRRLQWWCKWKPEWCIQCPKVSPVENFDVDRYIEKTWYIQKQQVNPYQKENQLYCVTATYSKIEGSDYISVDNYANNDEVNGESQTGNSFFSDLCSKQMKAGTGKLAVAPCFLNQLGIFDLLAGPYWVIDIAEDYSWAIVSGGQPKEVKQEDPILCTTKEGDSFLDTNGSGLWLFTRDQIASTEAIAEMEQRLNDMGVFTGSLKPVTQDGCNYEGANIKQ